MSSFGLANGNEDFRNNAPVLCNSKIEVEWKIKKFFKMHKKKKDCLESPTFQLSNANWCLKVYPNGDDKNSVEYMSFYLQRKSSKTDENHVRYTLGVKKNNGEVFTSEDSKGRIFKEGSTWGWSLFLKRAELKDSENVITPDGTVTFFCAAAVLDMVMDVPTKDAASQTLSTQGVETVSEDFKDLLLTERICDIKIKVEDLEFKAHKSVLSARSPVFSAMFEHDMEESRSGVVDIVDCDPESFQSFLLYLYSGKLDSVPTNKVLGLYETAHKYNVKGVKSECCQRLTIELSVNMVCDIVHLASMYNEAELLDTATEFFINNAHKVFTTVKWETFMTEHASIAKELLIKMANTHKTKPNIF